MDSSVKQNIKVTFEKVNSAFKNVTLKETKDYFLTLGNLNEIHMIKKDATKSIFLGKIFTSADATIDGESRKIWEVIGNYFRQVVGKTTDVPVVETKVEPVKKPTKRAKKVQVVEEVPEVSEDFASDDDTTWIDSIQ